jgi:hypothetical protein
MLKFHVPNEAAPSQPEFRRRPGTLLGALLYAALCAVLGAGPSWAVIIVTGDGTGNTTAPSDDPGFDNVGSVNGLSGVYLGNGWVLTAGHVGSGPIEFGGITYQPVPGSFQKLTGGTATFADVALVRMAGDPGLPTIALATTTPTTGSNVVMIGRGLSRGAAASWNGNDGWGWTSPMVKRWGANRVSTTGIPILNTESMILNFDGPGPAAVSHEAHVAIGDSGGAVYWKSSGTWYLAGTLFAALNFGSQPANTSLYGNATAAAEVSFYRSEIIAIVSVPACSNGLDDDLDGQIDFPDDPGCDDANDFFEQSPLLICDDGIDNDLDGFIDFPSDLGCASSTSSVEDPACNNGLDDDLDGQIDFADDPGCADPSDPSEQSAALLCDDGLDNDLDGFIDYPADPECISSTFTSESVVVPALSTLPTIVFVAALLGLGILQARETG